MTVLAWMARCRPAAATSMGWLVFQLGLFLLPSSALLAGLLLLTALVLGSCQRQQPFWRDPWNWPLLIAALLMLVGCVQAYSGGRAWVGLGNWLPFFWAFWGFQPYLVSDEARRRCALWLVAGTLPVVITGLGQLWWGWQGPWQLFGGLIVWFMAPGGEPTGRLSGLFDYANIAGAWLALVWPFCLAALLQPALSRFQRSVALGVAIAVVAALVLTDSRNAWGGLMLAIPFVFGPARWPWLLPLMVLALLPVTLAALPGSPSGLQQWARTFVPEGIWARLNDMRYIQDRELMSTRMSQWGVALQFIDSRPWLGWGAAAFSVLYPLRTGQWHGHAHNLPLELAVSHGIPVALLVVGTVLALLITVLRRGVLTGGVLISRGLSSTVFDRAWWTASLILVVMHATDMPFFDSRLNIAGWILLAGLRCIILPQQALQHARLGLDDDVR